MASARVERRRLLSGISSLLGGQNSRLGVLGRNPCGMVRYGTIFLRYKGIFVI